MNRPVLPALLATTPLLAHAETCFDNAHVRSAQPQHRSIAVLHPGCARLPPGDPGSKLKVRLSIDQIPR